LNPLGSPGAPEFYCCNFESPSNFLDALFLSFSWLREAAFVLCNRSPRFSRGSPAPLLGSVEIRALGFFSEVLRSATIFFPLRAFSYFRLLFVSPPTSSFVLLCPPLRSFFSFPSPAFTPPSTTVFIVYHAFRATYVEGSSPSFHFTYFFTRWYHRLPSSFFFSKSRSLLRFPPPRPCVTRHRFVFSDLGFFLPSLRQGNRRLHLFVFFNVELTKSSASSRRALSGTPPPLLGNCFLCRSPPFSLLLVSLLTPYCFFLCDYYTFPGIACPAILSICC